jgi:hypothetical protein
MSHLRFSLPLLLLACSALAGCAETLSRPASASTLVTSAGDVTKNACDQDKFWERNGDGDNFEACHDGSNPAQLRAEEARKAKAEGKTAASASSSPCGKMCRESGGSRASTQMREQRPAAPAARRSRI